MSTSPAAPAEWVWLARIRRPQGRKGEVFADILTDFPERFSERRHLWLIPDESAVGRVVAPSKLRLGGNIPTPSQSPRHFTESGFVTGHDFSRAAKPAKDSGALAPAGAPSDLQLGGSQASPHQVELVNHWLHKGGIVLHFAGIDSISAAETLAGLIVAIPRSQRTALPDDEVHIADLIGCTVLDVSTDPPQTIGIIDNVDRTAGPTPLLIVRSPKGEVLIPFAKTYLRTLDLVAHRVEMALPEGLADLNQS